MEKASKSFWDIFDPNNLTAANKELMSLLGAANFSNAERIKFISKIRKKLDISNISLDALTNLV